MVHTFDLTGRIVLITGGYGHLGAAVTESLAYHGATVYVLGRSRDKFEAAFQSIGTEGSEGTKDSVNDVGSGGDLQSKARDSSEGNIQFQYCDISSSASIQEAFQAVFNSEGCIDTIINNAFYLQGQNPLEMSDDDWRTGVEGTLDSVFKCIRHVIPFLEKSHSPRIVNVSSMYGMVAPDFSVYDDHRDMLNPPHYGAAKAGVIQLTRYYAGYLGPKGITVNCVTPGAYPPAHVQDKTSFIEKLSEKTFLKRIGNPEDLGGAFVYLASDASAYMTGQNLVIDGGWTAQ